ncbi:mercuric transport protein MerTP [Chitinophaga sp. Cy-1792]|uniref:mercuric transport protein MerTP n=1 Tax=Chitinophaga sp. Cy-1792 TaxID=2608339 RepID=UPI0014249473|nr:mercuric transport protein MerTP [Chitinophaga sp. Cy-1792]NIG55768.1 mercuric transport protein MerTP [Chitinophaga sp. Cy-1792]
MSNGKNTKALLGSGILLALTSSLCCIAPLLAIIGGAGGSMATFSWAAPLRPYLLGATALVLGLAFYQAYKAKPVSDCCAVTAKKSWLQSKGFLWTVAAMTVLLSSFPYYAKYLQSPAPVAKAAVTNTNHLQQVVLHIAGMGCEDCEGHVNKALQQLPGVHQVQTKYDKGISTVTFDSLLVSYQQLATTVERETGYKVMQQN